MKLIVSSLVAGALALGSLSAAPSHEDGLRPGAAILSAAVRCLLNFRHETPLSADQKEKIQLILQHHKADIQTQLGKGRDARQAMHSVVEKDGANSPYAVAAAIKIGEVARDRALLVARIRGEIKPILTPAQLGQMEQARNELQPLIDAAISNLQL